MSDQPKGEIEYRAATQLGVSFPNRTIELIVMPYEQETVVEHKGRMVREIVSTGAFDGIDRRANRIRVNRDHDVTRTVGRAIKFHPSRTEGLVAELRIAQTVLGDETLALADEEILDASAGFLPMPNGEQWPERDLRRLSKVWLAHVAMTPDPAYHGARVLSVRSGDVRGTPGASVASERLTEAPGGIERPRLAHALALRAADKYDRLSR